MEIVKKILNIFSKKLATTKTDTPQYVDLGLPSGLKWAKCNIGAKTETDYGYYFQWGDIEDKSNSDYSWATYKYCNGSSTTMTKYCTNSSNGTVDNKTTLDPEDDAATQIMGGDWRMPTSDECEELINNTINEWISDYNGTGVSGRKFTSKTDTSKYIFFPAAGGGYQHSAYDVGYYGDVWSSSLNISNPYSVWYLVFNSVNCSMGRFGSRYYGKSVRGVF